MPRLPRYRRSAFSGLAAPSCRRSLVRKRYRGFLALRADHQDGAQRARQGETGRDEHRNPKAPHEGLVQDLLKHPPLLSLDPWRHLASANFGTSAFKARRISGGTCNSAKRVSSVAPNTPTTSAPRSATASMPAIREMALLMPDAVPACWPPAALMTVVVSGATLMAIHRREECRPIGSADAGEREQGGPGGHDDRADRQRPSRAITGDEPTGPARQPAHDQSERVQFGGLTLEAVRGSRAGSCHRL